MHRESLPYAGWPVELFVHNEQSVRHFVAEDIGGVAGVLDAVVIEVWRLTAELLLAAAEWWGGGAKWLIREVEALDEARATRDAPRLHEGLHGPGLNGRPERLSGRR